jgi:short subunit dehydrogenase-like uncharacterized protein
MVGAECSSPVVPLGAPAQVDEGVRHLLRVHGQSHVALQQLLPVDDALLLLHLVVQYIQGRAWSGLHAHNMSKAGRSLKLSNTPKPKAGMKSEMRHQTSKHDSVHTQATSADTENRTSRVMTRLVPMHTATEYLSLDAGRSTPLTNRTLSLKLASAGSCSFSGRVACSFWT